MIAARCDLLQIVEIMSRRTDLLGEDYPLDIHQELTCASLYDHEATRGISCVGSAKMSAYFASAPARPFV